MNHTRNVVLILLGFIFGLSCTSPELVMLPCPEGSLISNNGCIPDPDNRTVPDVHLDLSDPTTHDDQIIAHNDDTYEAGDNWELYWAEEFNRPDIDFSIWSYEIGYGDRPDKNYWGWGGGNLQYYTNDSEHSFIRDDNLIIKATYSGGDLHGRNFVSARLKTEGKFSFRYGKIVARIKSPYGRGIWPAFWMMGTNISTVGWPYCGEIDIMEMFGGGPGKDNINHGTAHWFETTIANHGGTIGVRHPERLADKYHRYEIEWNPERIIWRFNDIEYHRFEITTSGTTEFHNDFFFIVNIAVGSWIAELGYPDESTIFPQYMYIDWIRVYKNKGVTKFSG